MAERAALCWRRGEGVGPREAVVAGSRRRLLPARCRPVGLESDCGSERSRALAIDARDGSLMVKATLPADTGALFTNAMEAALKSHRPQ